MKISFLMLFIGIFSISAKSYSQEAKISLSVENVTINEVFDMIRSQTSYSFWFDLKNVDIFRKVSISAEKESVRKVLSTVLKGQDLDIRINGNHIVIVPKGMTFEESILQEKKIISGIVADERGEPIIGANVVEKGTTNGVITDIDGKFIISVADNATLEISYIGYVMQNIPVLNQTVLSVILREDAQTLDEVIIVGFGTQKKVNLTGSVDQVGEKVFQNRALTNVSQGLQGALPNLNITFSDGKPNRAPAYNIRGTTSIGQGGNALVLIDGVEGDPSLLNPNDIESVSILKDAASASIYGARGTFGVVLITTKTPQKDVTRITYSSNYSLKSQTAKNDYVSDGFLWASMFSEAFSAWNNYTSIPQNVNKSMKFSLDYLNELERRSKDPSLPKTEIDPSTGEYVYYHNTNWYDLLYKDNMFSHDQNLSVSGSSGKVNYYLTGRYVDQPGIFRYNSDDFNSYNFRAKGTIQLFPWLSIQNNTSFTKTKYHNPLGAGEANIWRGLQYDAPPMAPMFNPDGTLTNPGAYSVGSFWYGKSGTDMHKRLFSNITSFTADLYKDQLVLKGDFSYSSTEQNDKRLRYPVPYSRFENSIEYLGSNTNDINEYVNRRQYIVANLYGEYENTFDKHYVKLLGGMNYELSTSESVSVSRNGLVWDGAEDINLALGQSISTSGGWQEWNVVGGLFRINYSFDNRYLIEFNGRYDGSSKFPSNDRYAFFPSVSAGWRVSEEPFWKISKDILSNLKVRASYGSLGNGNINPYVFNESFGVSRLGRILKGVRPQYTNQPGVLPEGLTWETATTTNFGADITLLNDRLNITADGYIRKTTDMFTTGVTLPAVFGASSPKGNYADLKTKGWEVSIAWRDRFSLDAKPFNYGVRLGVSDYTSEILKYNNPDKRLNDYYEGQRIGEIWGLVTGGFFTSEEEIKNWADQKLFPSSATGIFLPGDIKFEDLNGDGVINIGDNTVDSPGDKKIIGNSEPRYRFGLNLDADWNNFFFSCFFQGVGKQDWYPDTNCAPFWGQYVAQYADIPKYHLGNIWSEDNPDAYFPRYRAYIALSSSRSLGAPQTKYLQNAGYIRLKNVQFGYNLPRNILSVIKASEVQVYFSGENLWAYSPFYKRTKGHIDVENIRNADPETGTGGGGGHAYPILKSLTLGLKVSF